MQVIHKHYFGSSSFSSYISYKRNSRFVGISSVVLFSLLVFTILFPVQIKTDSSYARGGMLGNPSTTSLNLTLTNDTLALDLAATSSAGTFAASSPANFTVSTNNVSGYTLSIKSKVVDPTDTTEVTNASRLVNTDDGTKYISSISSSLAPATFSNISNTQYNNQWGYLPSKLNSSNNTNYLPAPDYDTATILNTTACANGTSPCTNNTDSYSITLGARVDGTLTAGTYEHAFTIIAVGNPVNYSITYDANDGANGANTTNMPSPNPQTGNTTGTYITLSNNIPRRTGYEFLGWCSVQPTANPNYPEDQVCPGGAAISQPSGVFGVDQTTVNIATLYAIWWQPNLTKLNANHATMQDMSPMACYNSSINDTATLTDDRDGTVRSYTVAKLADGLCWMTTNLNLGADHDEIELTPDDTDITTNFILPESTTEFETTNSFTTYTSPKVLIDSTYGGYYSYAAAIASTTSYTAGTIITTSICPKNWDLPSAAQYENLKTKGSLNNYNAAHASPYNFIYAGYRNGNSFSSQTSSIRLWTSTNSGQSSAYYSPVYNNTSNWDSYKRYGYSVRCVASSGTATVYYDGNGTTEYPVTGTTAAQENVEINSTMARANSFTRGTGWGFTGWNTAPDGSGVAIAANASVSNLGLAPGDTITLYAQWVPQYIINYVNNCKSWASSDNNCTDDASNTISTQAINLDASGNGSGTLGGYYKFILTNWKIKEWTTNANGTGTAYPVSSTYNITSASVGDSITLYAHWASVYSVVYNGNGADSSATDGDMVNIKHTNVAVGDWFDLFASNYKRSGYGFAGWSLNQITTTDRTTINTNVVNGTYKIYGPNETFNPDNDFPTYADNNGVITLYAVWIAPETGITMQTFDPTSATYSNMPNGSVIALEDNRDNDVYMVAKLADGNWWMGENLRLDNSATITASNTNNPLVDNGTVALKQTWYQNSSLSIAATTANHLSPSLTNRTNGNTYASFTGWCRYVVNDDNHNTNCFDQSMLNVWNKLHITNTATTGYTYDYSPSVTHSVGATTQTSPAYAYLDYPVYSYGNYYNWYSATAGKGTYSMASGDVDGDICPIGWHLPYGGNSDIGSSIVSGGFSYLDTKLTSPDGSHGTGGNQFNNSIAVQRWRIFPNNFVCAGSWGEGSSTGGASTSRRGEIGSYWSPMVIDKYNAGGGLIMFKSGVAPGSGGASKTAGWAVRCVINS